MTPNTEILMEHVAADFTLARAAVELRLIECIFADLPGGVIVASDIGIEDHHFAEDDHRLLWQTAAGMGKHGLVPTMRTARKALRWGRCWDDTAGPAQYGTCSRWSTDTLALLPHMMFKSDEAVRIFARRLIDLDYRQREARKQIAAALQILQEAEERRAA